MEQFKCKNCNKIFIRKYNLERHVNNTCKYKKIDEEISPKNKLIIKNYNLTLLASLLVKINKIMLENMKNELINEIKLEFNKQINK
jgi:uncharacterized C2H2 Zn-finger protein